MKQLAYNEAHGITPQTVKKQIFDLRMVAGFRTDLLPYEDEPGEGEEGAIKKEDLPRLLADLRAQMVEAAKDLDFERAAEVRDRIRALEAGHLGIKPAVEPPKPRRSARASGGGYRSRGRKR